MLSRGLAQKSDLRTCQASTVFKLDLTDNEAAFSASFVNFTSRPNEQFLVVGTAQDTILAPRYCKTGYLHTYKVTENGRSLELVHKVCIADSAEDATY